MVLFALDAKFTFCVIRKQEDLIIAFRDNPVFKFKRQILKLVRWVPSLTYQMLQATVYYSVIQQTTLYCSLLDHCGTYSA